MRGVVGSLAGIGIGAIIFASCSLDEIDLSGKACPCSEGWACDDKLKTCFPVHKEAGDGKTDGKGATGGKIEGGLFGGGTTSNGGGGGTLGGAAGAGGVAGSIMTGGGGMAGSAGC